jgi:hypothetical protein
METNHARSVLSKGFFAAGRFLQQSQLCFMPMKNDQRRALTPQDTLSQTEGCRHANPDICRNNLTPGKCAFVRKNAICLAPPLVLEAPFR